MRSPRRLLTLAAFVLCGWCLPGLAAAADSTITIRADLSRAPQRIYHGSLVMPVQPGPLTLLYPKYMPGEHGPTGPVGEVAGLRIAGNGQAIPWNRDPEDPFVFHLQVPAGVDRLNIELDYLPPRSTGQFGNGPSSSDQVAVLSWNTVLLYPAGVSIFDLHYQPSLKLPAGWAAGTALREAGRGDGVINYQTVSLEELVDSPVTTGAHSRTLDLTGKQPVTHKLHISADSEAALDIRPETEAAYKKLVAEGNAMFGSYHYRHYDFLLTLSDHVDSFGLEHHESSDNREGERALIDPARLRTTSTLLPHEYVHSWNAKYRRPAGLTRDDFQEPYDTGLLWVYEGLTQYLGLVLTARSGLWTQDYAHEAIALAAAQQANQSGRSWRPLEDTARAAYLLYGVPSEWKSWRRGVDFYDESALIWLEADVLIRQKTKGQESLEDFLHAFYAGDVGIPAVKPFTYDELVAALGQVLEYDWRSFFDQRIYAVHAEAPLAGLENGGWRLVYTDQPNARSADRQEIDKNIDLWYSLGLALDNGDDAGRVLDVLPGSAAGKAGVPPGSVLLAVNGRRWTKDLLLQAIREAANSDAKVRLLVRNSDFFHEYALDYHDGLRYPHLEQLAMGRDWLDRILAPLTH